VYSSLFLQVKENVTQWLLQNEVMFRSKNVVMEVVENSDERFYVILNFRKYMSAIIVATPDFAPYRFVAFELVEMVNDTPTMRHSWYDSDDDAIEDIIENLEKSVNLALEYCIETL